MPFEIVRNDITRMNVDAVVNTASRTPVVGYGVDLGINKKAGPKLLEARKEIGYIAHGQAAVTPGFDLPAKYVIHTAGPRWFGGIRGERDLLRSSYRRSLELAVENGCESVAFPLLSTGNRGVPPEISMEIAVEVFRAFLEKHDILIYLVVFDDRAFCLSESLFRSVGSYIDEHYVAEKWIDERNFPAQMSPESLRGARRRDRELLAGRRTEEKRRKNAAPSAAFSVAEEPDVFPLPCAPQAECAPAPMAPADLEAFLKQRDAGFAETLVGLIERSGKKSSEIYGKANVDRKLFSKIVNNINYHPSKPTAVAFAVALELELPAARDLIERAGYSLTHTNKFDLIIEYCIANRIYDVFEINAVLFRFDQPLLGNISA